MKTKILVVLAAIALVFALVFTACDTGGGGGGGPGGQTPGDQTTGGDDYDGTPGLAFELITSGAGRSARAANDGNAYRVRKGRVRSGEVKIPATYKGKPVREIGSANDGENNGAFADTDITDITIPETVELIGSNAFRKSRRLTRLVIPEGVTEICGEALYGCENITSITIPASVTVIYEGVFSGNERLTDIKVDPGNPNYRGEGGILYTNIEDIYVDGIHYTDDKEKTILHSYPSAKDSVTIPSSVTSIGRGAFQFCTSLTSITIPASVTAIVDNAFLFCINLTSVTIAEGVKIIFRSAFAYCTSLTSIEIPASVIQVDNGVFIGCTNLTSITVAPGNSYLTSEDGMLLSNSNPSYLALYAYPSAKGNVTNLLTDLKSIDNSVFENNTNITGITIPNGLEYIGIWAFAGCTSITSITIPTSVTYISGYAFEGWTASQTINIQGKANREATIAAGWNNSWDDECNAKIVYQP